MPGKNKLDFAVVPDKARQLHNPETRKYIEDLFRVQVKIPLPHQEMQWITVHGPNARCKLAKAYIIALCDPVSTTEMCDKDLFARLFTGDSDLLRTVEADYAVVIQRCQNYMARIQGSDELSVTLAMSKLSEIGCGEDNGVGIDRHLSVAMEEQCDPTSLSSSLAHQPEVVKRTMLLEIVKDDSGSEDEAIQETPRPVVPPQQETPVEEPQPMEQPSVEEKTTSKRFRDRDLQEKIDYFTGIGYKKDVVMKVLGRVGKKASVNSILDHLIRVSSSKPDTNARPKMDTSARPPSRHHEQPLARAPASKLGPANKPGKQSVLRYIVIDGSNVAMSHGRRQVFSCMGIKCAVDYFVKRGHKQITAFVPAWRKEMNNPNNQITDPHILKELEEMGYLVFTPSRRTDRKRILPYDDRFIVRLAMETNGIILSNDYFRDLLKENESWRDTIENRVLPYTFVEDFLMIPDDPLGAKGPTLDEFLTCSSVTEHPSCPKPEQSKPASEKKMCKFYPKCTFGNKCAFRHPDSNLDTKEETPPPRRENLGAKVTFNDRHRVPAGSSYAHAVGNTVVDEPPRRESVTRVGYSEVPNKMMHQHSGGCLFPPHRHDMQAEQPSKNSVFAAARNQMPPAAGLLPRDSLVHNMPHSPSARHNSFPPTQQPMMYSGHHLSQQHSGPLHQQQQHSGPLSQQYNAHVSQQHSGPLSQHSGPLPPPYQGDIHTSGGNYAMMHQQQPRQQQQHYMHQMHNPRPMMSHDPRYSQQPVNSYGHGMYPPGYAPSHSMMRHPSGMNHHVAVPHHMQPYEHFERDSKPMMNDDHHSTLVKQATSLLQGLTSEPIEPKVRNVLAKNPSLTDLDAIIDCVLEMD